jgi:DcmR-like sensory protein/histidine kinase-like protein
MVVMGSAAVEATRHAGPASHVVQFYRCDGELVPAAGEFLGGALAAGGAAIVVATPAHLQAFGERLAGAGVDLAAARAQGRFVTLEAQAALDQFAAGGRPDAEGFDRVVGQIVRRAAQAGQPLAVYGEMVALLWQDGRVNGALELEALWNRLGADTVFSLFCAYPAESVAASEHAGALGEVCGLHSSVVGIPREAPVPAGPAAEQIAAARSFPGVRNSPRAARRFVTQTLVRWGAAEFADDAALVVTELATNAVLHARSGFTVAMSWGGGALRICVSDTVPLPAGQETAPLPARTGHGLGVVGVLATRWRAEPADGGKAVWAELRA